MSQSGENYLPLPRKCAIKLYLLVGFPSVFFGLLLIPLVPLLTLPLLPCLPAVCMRQRARPIVAVVML